MCLINDMHLYICNHTHKYLGMAASDHDHARTLRCKANIKRRTLLILAVCCLWLTYSNVCFTTLHGYIHVHVNIHVCYSKVVACQVHVHACVGKGVKRSQT